MTATTRNAPGSAARPMGAVLAVAAVGLALAGGVAIGTLVSTHPQAAAAPAAPIAGPNFDHGSSSDSSNVDLRGSGFDRGWASDPSNVYVRTAPVTTSSQPYWVELMTRDQAAKPDKATQGAGGGSHLNRFAR